MGSRSLNAEEELDYGELLEKIQSGDAVAERRLVKTFWRGVVAILYQQTRDRELSHDLAQETLLLVLEKARAGEIREPRALKTYIRKVSENKLIGQRRKESRQKTETASDYIDTIDGEHSLIIDVRMSELQAYVRTVLDELGNDRDREILRRHYLIGEDKDIVCAALDLSRAQADTVLHRARQRLKTLILNKASRGDGPGLTDMLLLLVFVTLVSESRAVHAEPTALASESTSTTHLIVVSGVAVCPAMPRTSQPRVCS